jgi:ATP-dependent metalloprotease
LLSLTFLIVIAVGINKGPAGLAGLSSTAKEIAPEVCKVRFTDVKGCDEARDEAAQLVHFLKNPQAYTDMGAELPRGMLLTGPPGTGKTLLAKAVAGEAGVPFFSVSGSSFDEIFVGTGAKRVRELFASAKEKAPCIVFIDEIDALGGARSKRQESQHRQTLNALLVEMDGFATNHGVLVMGATNLPDALDKALLRPGRFDRTLHLALPDSAGRRQILDLYVGQIAAGPDVDTHVLARATPGASGATLQGIVNAAAIYAAQKGRSEVTMGDFEYAKDKLLMGAARESAIIAPGEKRKTAYHEGGHAICALYTEGAVPIYKATVMPRGRALGMVMQLPEDDMVSMTKKEMLARLDVAMGGRVAEEVIYGADNVTSGASSDFQQATSMAQAMVMNYGFGKTTGLLAVNDLNEVSGDTRRLIDAEVQGLLDASYARSKRLITKNREKLERLADGLCKYETITLDEIYQVVDGKELAREI